MTNSKSKQRTLVRPEVFGHDVVGTLTGRTMSTPDADKPELVEVAVTRTDNEIGLVWVPKEQTRGLDYLVSVECHHDDHMSPTDSVLSTIEWLRSPQVGGITFRVHSPTDNVTYTVEATQADEDDVDAWVAEVTAASEPNPQNANMQVPRPDLIPDQE